MVVITLEKDCIVLAELSPKFSDQVVRITTHITTRILRDMSNGALK